MSVALRQCSVWNIGGRRLVTICRRLSCALCVNVNSLTFVFQGFKSQAMAVTCDAEHKFELCVQLGDYRTAYNLAKDMQVLACSFLFYTPPK